MYTIYKNNSAPSNHILVLEDNTRGQWVNNMSDLPLLDSSGYNNWFNASDDTVETTLEDINIINGYPTPFYKIGEFASITNLKETNPEYLV